MGQPLAHVLCSLPESGPHPGGGRGRAWAPAVEGGETLSEASLASRRHQSRMAPESLPHPSLPCQGASGSPGASLSMGAGTQGPTLQIWGLEPRNPYSRSGDWNPGTPTPDLGTGTQGPPLQILGLEPRNTYSRSGGWNPGTPTADLGTGTQGLPLQVWPQELKMGTSVLPDNWCLLPYIKQNRPELNAGNFSHPCLSWLLLQGWSLPWLAHGYHHSQAWDDGSLFLPVNRMSWKLG